MSYRIGKLVIIDTQMDTHAKLSLGKDRTRRDAQYFSSIFFTKHGRMTIKM